MTIALTDTALSIDDVAIELPIPEDVMLELLGDPSRRYDGDTNDVVTYDDLGLHQ